VRTRLVTTVLVAGLVLASVASADNYTIRLNSADNAAARATVLRPADLGTSASWRGGMMKPDLSYLSCPNYDPKHSDLVVTGAAQSTFANSLLRFDSEAELLQTAAMLRLDWQRSVLAPTALPCFRSVIRKGLGPGARNISLRRIAFPAVAPYTAAFRVLFDVTASGKSLHLFIDLVLIGRGRTEITLSTIAPLASKAAVLPAEIRLARILASRAT
jgi:hypothetical protein